MHASRFFHRGFCLCCVAAEPSAAAGGPMLTPAQAYAKSRGIVNAMKDYAASSPISLHEVRGRLTVLEGSGGNMLASFGEDGMFLVDAGIAVSETKIKESLASWGSSKVAAVVNTHWHFDHADGNDWLGREGAKIIAHEKTLSHLSAAQRVEDWNFDFPPSAIQALPSIVVGDTHELDINRDRVRLKFYGNAHTDGDLSVFFQNSNVLHTGDTFWNGIYPFIDRSTGGTIDGMISAAQWNVDICDADTLVVSGHAKPVGNREELKAYLEMLVAIRESISANKSKGMSLEEVQAQRPTSSFDAVWGQFVITPDFFTKLVYESL